MSEMLREEKDSSLNANSYYDFKRRLNINENCRCEKCFANNKDTIVFSCGKESHSICFNCTFIYFISSNFEGLTTNSITTKCPKCQNGILEINLEDYIKILELLLVQKNPNFSLEESNKKSFGEIGENKVSKAPQKKGITDSNKKDGKESKNNLSFEKLINNNEINKLQENEKKFLQGLESKSIEAQIKVNQIVKDLNNLLQNYINKIYLFQNNMKKIFQIINLTYYNYYTSSNKDKKEINISQKLEDFSLFKNIDFDELDISFNKENKKKRENRELIYKEPHFNFQLQFSGTQYEERFRLYQKREEESDRKNQKKEKEVKECVTKIIEFDKGNKIISSMMNGQILVWDVNYKELLFTIDAHESAIWAMIKLSDDKIATGSSDKLIKIWDVLNENTEPIMVLKERPKKKDNKEGKGKAKNVKNEKNLKNEKDKNALKTVKKAGGGHKGTVFCLAEIEKNKLLSGSEDRTIKLWDLTLEECIKTLEDPYDSKINCLYVLKDPGFIVTGGDDNLLKIWNVYSTYVPNILSGHECTIWSIVSINDDDSIIASGSSDNTIKIWDLIALKCLFTLSEHENSISSLRLLNNNLLVSSSWDSTVKIWNLITKTCIQTLEGHTNIVWDVIQMGTGDIVSCSSDGDIIIWSKDKIKEKEKEEEKSVTENK